MQNGHLQYIMEWGAELGVEIAKDLEDKKLSLGEAIGLFDNALKIPAVVKRIKKIPQEWETYKDNPEYEKALVEGVGSKINIGSETAKEIVLQSIKTGIQVGKLIELCVKASREQKK